MFSIDFLLKLLNKDKVAQYIYTLLLISLINLFDFFTLYVFGTMIGIFLYIALIGAISILGVFVVIKLIKKHISIAEKLHNECIYPKDDFYHITGLFTSSFLIIFPGLISSTIGLILLLPYFRYLIGRIITKSLKLDWNAVYEYKEIYKN